MNTKFNSYKYRRLADLQYKPGAVQENKQTVITINNIKIKIGGK